MWLAEHNIDFDYESIRVKSANPKIQKTFISDFSFGNKVIEVKGIKSSKDSLLKDSFTKAGYDFTELFIDDINLCKKFLIEKITI